MKNFTRLQWFAITVAFAFCSFLMAMQIDSYRSDLHKLNPLYYTLTITTGVCALVALYFTIKSKK